MFSLFLSIQTQDPLKLNRNELSDDWKLNFPLFEGLGSVVDGCDAVVGKLNLKSDPDGLVWCADFLKNCEVEGGFVWSFNEGASLNLSFSSSI